MIKTNPTNRSFILDDFHNAEVRVIGFKKITIQNESFYIAEAVFDKKVSNLLSNSDESKKFKHSFDNLIYELGLIVDDNEGDMTCLTCYGVELG